MPRQQKPQPGCSANKIAVLPSGRFDHRMHLGAGMPPAPCGDEPGLYSGIRWSPTISSAGMDSERDQMAEASLPRGCGVRRPSRPADVPADPTADLTVATLKDLADKSAALK